MSPNKISKSNIAESPAQNEERSFRPFFIIWVGQLIAITGTEILGFSMSVWVYQTSGSVTQFTLLILCNLLPRIFLSPVVGVLVDRWNRKWIMVAGNSLVVLVSFTLYLLVSNDVLVVSHLYILSIFASSFLAFQGPALKASISTLVPPKHFSRAAGITQMASGTSVIIAPSVAGVLLGVIGLQGIVLINIGTLLFSVTALLFVRIPSPEKKHVTASVLQDFTFALKFLHDRPGLFRLFLLFGFNLFIENSIIMLFTPLMLHIASPELLGFGLSFAGCGVLLGGLTMGTWGGPSQRVLGIIVFMYLQGCVLMVFLFGQVSPNVIVMLAAGGAFVFMFCSPFIRAMNQATFQVKVAPDVQGRIFALLEMSVMLVMAVAYPLIGPLADKVFEPLMAEGGELAGTAGLIIGVGDGRGIALMFILFGILNIIMASFCLFSSGLRNLEKDLPDAVQAADASLPDVKE